MQRLLLHRAGVPFEGVWLGPVLAVPTPPAPELLDDADGTVIGTSAIAAHLGLDRDLQQVGAIDAIVPYGLHDPTPWERRILAWIAERLGVVAPPETPAPNGPFAAYAEQLADPIATWDAPPTGVALLHGEDPELEAIGAARWLRQALLGVPEGDAAAWLDGTLVLIPDDPVRHAVWRETLTLAGLPVRTRRWRSLDDTAVGRWVLTLAALGTVGPLRRDDLHLTMESPFFALPEGGSRADIRALLRSLRRPTVTLDQLHAHTHAWFEARRNAARDREDLEPAERTDEIADLDAREAAARDAFASLSSLQLSDNGFWGQLKARFAPKIQASLRAADQHEEAAAAALIVDLLSELRNAETPADTPVQTLQSLLAARGRGVRSRPVAGVRLQSWTKWDGVGGHHVVLAGLEEGGWPAASPPPSLAGKRLADALGLGTPSDELARQGRVTQRAAASATEALLVSWSDTDSAGSETFPGAALAGLSRLSDAPKAAWRARTTHVRERDVLPDAPASAYLPRELRLWPRPEHIDDPAWQASDAARAHGRRLRAARSPADDGTPVGPWSGDLGAPVPEQTWSASALETLGQCGAKFLSTRLLRAEREHDGGALLEASEAGSLIHEAFAQAALTWRRVGQAWELLPANRDVGQGSEAAPARSEVEVSQALDEAFDTHLRANPTLGVGITGTTKRRWHRQLSAFLSAHTEPPKKGPETVPRRVVAAEWSFGMPVRQDTPTDPSSVEAPLEVELPEQAPLRVRGRVDRIDADHEHRHFRVLDYKTGSRSASVKANFGLGLHLQLPLYALAAAELLAPTWGADASPSADEGHLLYPRDPSPVRLDLANRLWRSVDGDDDAAPAENVGASAVLTAHLGASARRLRAGVLPLAPTQCPIRGDKAYCDLAASCGFRDGAAPLDVPFKAQRFVESKDAKDTGKPSTKTNLTPPVALDAPADPPTAAAAFSTATSADAVIDDLHNDVIVSAGAGSGKTTRLVRRYLRALEGGAAPDAILALTFTRKATAEMRTRVRSQLLQPNDKLPETRRRSMLLALGSAPILTIDAFAAHVVRCLAPADAVDVTTDDHAFNSQWVEGQLVEACEAPDADLRLLLEALPVARLQGVLSAWIARAPDRLEAFVTLSPDRLVRRWLDAAQRANPKIEEDIGALIEAIPEVRAAVAAAESDASPKKTKTRAEDEARLREMQATLDRIDEARCAYGPLVAMAIVPKGSPAKTRPLSWPFEDLLKQRMAWATASKAPYHFALRESWRWRRRGGRR